MTAIAWANGMSEVSCTDGTKGESCGSDPDRWRWNSPLTSRTAETSNDRFFVQGIPVAVQGDKMEEHPNGAPCTQVAINHEPSTSLHAGAFFIGGKMAMRIGSKFNEGTSFDHTISTGCDNFIIGGIDG